jgi:hypothetical protein
VNGPLSSNTTSALKMETVCSPKCQHLRMSLHDIKPHEKNIIIHTALKTVNPVFQSVFKVDISGKDLYRGLRKQFK